jgi:hypothetical protein
MEQNVVPAHLSLSVQLIDEFIHRNILKKLAYRDCENGLGEDNALLHTGAITMTKVGDSHEMASQFSGPQSH